ncbi:MAG: type II secretion system F family protein [Acidimicrobiia bacterium]
MRVLVPAVCGFTFIAGLIGAVVSWRGFDVAPLLGGMRAGLERLASLRLVAPVLAGVVTLGITRWLVGAVLVACAVAVLPSVFTGHRARAARLARTEAIASWAEMLRDTLAGAAGLEETIVATAAVAPAPIRPEVARLARRLEVDQLVPSLRELADDLRDPTGDLVVSALMLAAERQARDLGGLLGSLAASARQRAAMQLRVEAGRARTRSAVQIITVFTLAFAAGMVLLNRGYLKPYDSPLGQVVLALVGGCFGASIALMERMTRAQEPDRLLVRDVTTTGGR